MAFKQRHEENEMKTNNNAAAMKFGNDEIKLEENREFCVFKI